MKLSIIVIFHNMQREARRTLYSLSPDHQRDVTAQDYEVIAIDNGSARPLAPEMVRGFGPNFRYHFFDTTSVSPVAAMNHGAEIASGGAIAVIVDGARMATPGLVKHSLSALALNRNAFACALSWHLGPDIQTRSILNGYDQAREDAMLLASDWRNNGYGLFEISTLAPSSGTGFFGGFPTECSWFCMDRQMFFDLGGFNPAFQSPGGGRCNHEFRDRALQSGKLVPTILLGEGVFHQVHGGIATNAPPDAQPQAAFHEEYRRITGHDAARVSAQGIVYVGGMPTSAKRFMQPNKR